MGKGLFSLRPFVIPGMASQMAPLSAPVLAAPQLDQLQVDAKDVGTGAVLLQTDGEERPIKTD